jgi:GH25 family lysozyme M1 (1,4-beta-N-acetylmuramidase)
LDKTSGMESLLDNGFPEKSTRNDIGNTTATNETAEINQPDKELSQSSSNVHYGIDISHFQGDIITEFNKNNNLSFVICKATQGNYFVDPDFRNNWNEIKAKGLIRGTYHFYDCKISPVDQANFFCTNVSDIGPNDIAPILDIEQGSMTEDVSGDQMEADILVFLKTVEQKLNRKPMIYTDYAFAQEYLKNPAFADYDLWLAEYSGSTKPLVPDIWKAKGYKMWQKSSSYNLYSQKVDLDEYTGQLSDIVK